MALGRDSPPSEAAVAEVFGPRQGAQTLKEWSRRSKQLFVRNHTHIARWSPEATGRVLTACEALEAFKWNILRNLVDKRVAALIQKGCEVAPALQARRAATGLTISQVAKKTGVPADDISAAEAGTHRIPIRVLTKLSRALALDDVRIGAVPDGGGDIDLGVRLRELQGSLGGMSPAVVLGLAEAAWVIATQSRLETWLDPERIDVPSALGFQPVSVSGSRFRPAWRDGMDLAHQTRELLGLTQDEPIRGLKDVLEKRLAIPVIQVDLPERFAGATISNGNSRGIAVNVNGINQSVWTRRMTMGHELGHLLWDPNADLNRLRVDDYETLNADVRGIQDRVEMRANAFAAEFLAPQAAVMQQFGRFKSGANAVSEVMETFGVSFTCASWQIFNGADRSLDRTALRSLPNTVPSSEWNAGEALNADFFVFKDTPIARTGRFAELCLLAFEANLISSDTAAEYLSTDASAFAGSLQSLRSLFGVA